MPQRYRTRTALLASFAIVALSSSALRAQEAITIDTTTWGDCLGQTTCQIGGATLASSAGALVEKKTNGAVGIGIGGGPSGPEIDIGETLRITFAQPREVAALQVLFLYNGPEFDDRAEVARITANGAAYTLAVGSKSNNAAATWNGSGSVESCGTTTGWGTGCFLISDPFPSPVSEIALTALPGSEPYAGGGTSDSDFSLGFVEVAGGLAIDLNDCADLKGCVIARVNGEVAATLNSVKLADPDGPSGVTVYRVHLPDCRYLPRLCRQTFRHLDHNAAFRFDWRPKGVPCPFSRRKHFLLFLRFERLHFFSGNQFPIEHPLAHLLQAVEFLFPFETLVRFVAFVIAGSRVSEWLG